MCNWTEQSEGAIISFCAALMLPVKWDAILQQEDYKLDTFSKLGYGIWNVCTYTSPKERKTLKNSLL
jgi:hypothetical protein